MRRTIAAVCVAVAASLSTVPACSHDQPPNSVFDAAGYHVRGDKVYYLASFPGKAAEIAGADVASFKAFGDTYAKDRAAVYFDGRPIPGADAASFGVLDRNGFAKDRNHVYQLDRTISDDPTHFELLDGGLSKDGTAVYWTDGSVLSRDPAHFAIVSTNDQYLFTKDGAAVQVNGKPIANADPATFRVLQGAYAQDARHVFYFTDAIPNADAATFHPLDGPYAGDAGHAYWMGKVIEGADPTTFRVLNAAFECSADAGRAYYRQSVIAGADPRTFPAGRAVTGCTESAVSFTP